MEFLNKIIIRGIVGRVQRTVIHDKTAVDFSVVTQTIHKQNDGTQTCETTWFRITGWEHLSGCEDLKEIQKTSVVEITGRVRPVKYTNAFGDDVISWEVIAQKVRHLGMYSKDIMLEYQNN